MTEHDKTFPDDDELSPETAAAMRLLVRQCRDQAEAERRIRALLLEEHRAVGRIPKWLITPAPKRDPDDVNDGRSGSPITSPEGLAHKPRAEPGYNGGLVQGPLLG